MLVRFQSQLPAFVALRAFIHASGLHFQRHRIGKRYVVDPVTVGFGWLFLRDHDQYGGGTFAQDGNGFQHGVFKGIGLARNSHGFAMLTAQDRPLPSDGVMHGQAKLCR
ncbi:hypothetical protein [Dyella sp. M7H15-1]|uniref:hypothetical protein n=1 Tax=Dyella sp. M7H15-1 TaxID=2501295 RepID=UPI0013E8CA05|nr:hypothetical protein [Dyella sp. M7H15-1]